MDDDEIRRIIAILRLLDHSKFHIVYGFVMGLAVSKERS